MANEAKQLLLETLKGDAEAISAALGRLSPEELEQGRYEDGWNAREILAHIAAIEWTYPRLLQLAGQRSDGTEERVSRATDGGMDGYNARQVAKRAHVGASELLAEFRKNREATIAAIEAADDTLLATPIRSTGGREGTVLEVLEQVAVGHVREHLGDLEGTQ